MRRAPEALRVVNSGLGTAAKIDAVELGRYYGDASARTLRVVHNPPVLHPFQPYSPADVADQIAYFQKYSASKNLARPSTKSGPGKKFSPSPPWSPPSSRSSRSRTCSSRTFPIFMA